MLFWFGRIALLVVPGIAAACLMAASPSACSAKTPKERMGPLTVSRSNPRYFESGSGKIVYLTGSHTWANLQDWKGVRELAEFQSFSYPDYLAFLARHNHNFFRLWAWEQAKWFSPTPGDVSFSPSVYVRTGPGKALDGEPRFDLTAFNKPYFERLRSRVMAARNQGIYVCVMLFNGFSIKKKAHEDPGKNPWQGHPFNIANNINGINGDPKGWGDGRDTHTLKFPAVTAIQEAYVQKVLNTLNDQDNVLWEISNESEADSTSWQYHMIDYIHQYEMTKGKRHPVLMTAQWPKGTNRALMASRAEAISPNSENGYRDDPPAIGGQKVIIIDTDHLWGVGGDFRWVWKSFLRGLNPIFMDPYANHLEDKFGLYDRDLKLIRSNMGYTLAFSNKINLKRMAPRPDLASSHYCLAEEGQEYLIYTPDGALDVNLAGPAKTYTVEWFNPLTGATIAASKSAGGGTISFIAPFSGDAVLHLKAYDRMATRPSPRYKEK